MGDTMSVTRAYRVVLDPTREQQQVLTRHTGAARWAYNHALATKVAAHRRWRQEVAWATYEHGVDEATARAMVTVPIPTKPAIQKALNEVKGDSRAGCRRGLPLVARSVHVCVPVRFSQRGPGLGQLARLAERAAGRAGGSDTPGSRNAAAALTRCGFTTT